MAPPTRRRVLAGAAGALTGAGCLHRFDHDPVLRLRNSTTEDRTVRVTVYRQFVGEPGDEERFYEERLAVEPSTTRNLEVFTEDDQYRVVVERGDRRVEFPTRPICDAASTSVTLLPSGHIEYRATFCEGNDRAGSSRES